MADYKQVIKRREVARRHTLLRVGLSQFCVVPSLLGRLNIVSEGGPDIPDPTRGRGADRAYPSEPIINTVNLGTYLIINKIKVN